MEENVEDNCAAYTAGAVCDALRGCGTDRGSCISFGFITEPMAPALTPTPALTPAPAPAPISTPEAVVNEKSVGVETVIGVIVAFATFALVAVLLRRRMMRS